MSQGNKKTGTAEEGTYDRLHSLYNGLECGKCVQVRKSHIKKSFLFWVVIKM